MLLPRAWVASIWPVDRDGITLDPPTFRRIYSGTGHPFAANPRLSKTRRTYERQCADRKADVTAMRDMATIVTPDTLLAWHRLLIAKQYDGSPRRGPGRPPVIAEIRALIVRMATDNRGWGYTRIQGALANLDHVVSRSTIASILREHGLDPAPERVKKTTWTEFLKTHWDVLAATDFFTVNVWTIRGLTRFVVLFIIEVSTRQVEIAGIATEPDSAWMGQMSRILTDATDGFLTGKRFLIHDRDPLFTLAFRETLAAAGVQVVPGFGARIGDSRRTGATVRTPSASRVTSDGRERRLAGCHSRVAQRGHRGSRPSRV